MTSHRVIALTVALAMTGGAAQTALLAAGQEKTTISGTAKEEAKKPYTDYSVRARDAAQAQIAGTTPLSAEGNFTLPDLAAAKYYVELLNKDGKVVCTEGPFDLTKQALKNDVEIECNKTPAAWWLLGAAAAAGVTAGLVVANGSPSR